MKRFPRLSVLVLAAFIATACDDDSDLTGVDESCANLSGTFVATGFTATGTNDTNLTRNFLTNGGGFTTTFNNGTYNTTYIAQTGATPLLGTGNFTRAGQNVTLQGTTALWTGGATGNQTFRCSLQGNTLTLTQSNTTFDFAGTGSPQPARINVTLTRQPS